ATSRKYLLPKNCRRIAAAYTALQDAHCCIRVGCTRLALFSKKVFNLISLRENLDLSTSSGRLLANVLASVAAFETEVRSERQMAGIAAARAAGKPLGRPLGSRHSRIPPEKRRATFEHHAAGWKVADIAKAVGLARKTVYALLKENRAQ